MAVAHSQQLRLWDPQALFKMANPDKFNDVTCVGWAVRRDRRCERHTGKDRRRAAECLMNRLAYVEPRQVIEHEITRLEEIAYYCICTTHHDRQSNSIVSEWVASLEEEQTRLESRQARGEIERSGRFVSARVSRSGSRTSAVTSSQDRIERRERSTWSTDSLMTPPSTAPPPAASASAIASPVGVAAQLSRNRLSAEGGGDINTHTREEDMRRDMQREIEDLRRTIDRLVRDIRMGSTESQRPGEADAVVPLPVTLAQDQEPSLSVIPVREPDLSPDPEPEAESTPPPPTAQHCLQHHRPRRSIDEDCPICTMAMVNCRLSELVWCKQQCGRSVHKDCFEQMLAFASNSMRCVYCRSSWSTSCSHDEQAPEQFEFWTQWDLGFDTFFDPQHHGYDFWDAAYETNLPSLFQAERYWEQQHSSDEGSEEVGISATDWDYDADDES